MRNVQGLAAVLAMSWAVCGAAEVQVRPIGLSVGAAELEEMDFGLRPNGVNTGVGIHVLFSGFDMPVVALDEEASTLSKMTDSTGKDLLAKPEPKGDGGFSFTMTRGPLGPFPHISEDGKQVVIELIAPQAPAPGAASVDVEGSIVLRQATGTAEAKSAPAALVPGKVHVGAEQVEITGFGPSDWEEGKFKLTVRMTTALHEKVASFKVLDEQGGELCDGPFSTMTMTDTVELELSLPAKPGKAVIALELYQGVQEVKVPVRLQVGLGLASP